MTSYILIVDDDAAICASIALTLKQAGHVSQIARTPQAALDLIHYDLPRLVIMDMNYSRETTGDEGLELLSQIRNIAPSLPVILITAWGTIDLAVQGMKLGAFDFMNKPWDNAHLLQRVETALTLGAAPDQKTMGNNRTALDEKYDFKGIVGENPQFLRVLETVGRVSSTDAPILILGDSGTGKELIAEAIHNNSARRDGPFVKVNLGGISTSLFESEMFGHKRGSFTDAKHDRIGRFEKAHTGTIFLDEIGDLDLSSQVKLMRVLQDRSFEVLGSSQTRRSDFRVVSATNRDLESMVSRGEFREDLYYRINLISVRLPALNEREEDIPRLVQHYLNNLKRIYDRPDLHIDPGAMNWLKNTPWPGNIRALKNLIERTVLVCPQDTLGVNDLAAQMQPLAPQKFESSGMGTIEEMEIALIKKAMGRYDANISKVAEALGLSRAALYRRLEKYGLDE